MPPLLCGEGESVGGDNMGGVGCPPKHEKVGGGECMLCAAPSPVVMNGEVHHNSIAPLARLDNGMRGRSEAEEVPFSAPSLSLVQDALFYFYYSAPVIPGQWEISCFRLLISLYTVLPRIWYS